MNFRKSIATVALLLAVAAGSLHAQKTTIVETAVSNPDFSTLVTALKTAELVSTLQGEGPFTVFAPTNEAFDKLPEGAVAMLLEPENKSKLQAVLTYHVVAGTISSEALAKSIKKGGGTATVETVNGSMLSARMTDEGGIELVDGDGRTANVIKADLNQKNGVIHVIDAVVMPK